MVSNENSNNIHQDVQESEAHDNDHGKDMVTIFVNDKPVEIHRGRQTVAAIKAAGNVPSTDILYEMPNYETPLNDTDIIGIKGGERFKSSAPNGGSS